MYLLLLIAFSLSLAANQYLIGVITGAVGLVVIYVWDLKKKEKSDNAFVYLTMNKDVDINIILRKLITKNNRVLSIENDEKNINIVSTLNKYTQDEIVAFTNWLKDQQIEFRITSNQID